MHRLFWKIFLSFWAALIVFAGATILAASHYLEQTRQQQEAASPRERLARYAAEAQHIAELAGIEGLKKWLREIDRSEPVPLLLVDREGAELLGRTVPPLATERMMREGMRPRHMGPMARPRALIRLPDQSEYLLIPDFQGVTLGRVLARPRVIALPLVVAALVSGLVCLVLARYLTAPLARLRRATESYASGDLSARVAPSLGARRDEVAELARAFDRMAEQLQALMGAQRQLLSDVSHELRSPLARLQVALGLARQRAEGRASGELDRIERESERLNELIGQVLSLARLESGVTAPAREPVDLAELLERVAADADFEARAANRRVEISQSTPAMVEGDARLLRSALENIARNAVRYTAEGTAVTLSLARDPQQARWLVTIRDHGPGVPDDMLPRLFEPFVRVGDARDRATGGYGLGLAIARKAIHLHGGGVSASNEPSGGLRIVVALPATR
jgi:two-component system sensor histidine kinase CpxA